MRYVSTSSYLCRLSLFHYVIISSAYVLNFFISVDLSNLASQHYYISSDQSRCLKMKISLSEMWYLRARTVQAVGAKSWTVDNIIQVFQYGVSRT
jgi:hypothetical protein